MSRKPFSPPVDTLDHELLAEKATALGRVGRSLDAALADLRAFDAAHPRPHGGPADAATARRRRELVQAAGRALWMFAVQREACGLYETRSLKRDLAIPPEVWDCMGMMAPRPTTPTT